MTLTMPKLLDDGCVLQSGRPVNIWGWCTPGERVSVRIGECTGETISAADGGWQVRLDALDPGGPYAFEVIGDGTTVRRSCYAGEVFLCSGQSNMELSMQWVHPYYPSEFQRQDDPLLRQFKVVDRYDFSGPVRDHEEASWLGCAPEALGQFSAVAYFFGRMVRQWLQVPVGLLNVSLGGSPIEAWMDAASLDDCPEALEELDPYLGDGVAEARSEESLSAVAGWMEELQARRIPADKLHWRHVDLPARFEDCGLPGFQGMLELRRTVVLPPYCEGAEGTLRLGAWADIDETYINGINIGGRPNQYEPRDYRIPAGMLRAGANEIVVRLVCNAGSGRVTEGKAMTLQVGDEVHDVSGIWRLAVVASMDRPCPSEDFVRWRPTGLYNAMLAPCFRFPVRAALWYQGESNTGTRAAQYGKLLATMIDLWRERWHDPHMPFLIVQLPGISIDCIEDGGWSLVRAGQWAVGKQVPDVKTVVTLDAGEPNDLHPHDKKLVASRLFDAACALLYGGDNVQPMVERIEERDGMLCVSYATVARQGANPVPCTPLTLDGGDPGEFEFVWRDAMCAVPAPATVEGAEVCIPLPERRPDILRYAWRNNPSRGLLVDGRGTPMPPFAYDLKRGAMIEPSVRAGGDVDAGTGRA